jgi:hypothetical protein
VSSDPNLSNSEALGKTIAAVNSKSADTGVTAFLMMMARPFNSVQRLMLRVLRLVCRRLSLVQRQLSLPLRPQKAVGIDKVTSPPSTW